MNVNIKIFLLCPLPENQKPINEYLLFKENFFFKIFLKKQKKNNNFVAFDSSFIFSALNNLKKNNKKNNFSFFFIFLSFFFISTNIFFVNLTSIIFFFYFLQFFIYLNYLQKRFLVANLIYEESSWYDSQVWNKPLSLIKNDHLLCTQKLNVLFLNLLFN